jgi:hypothetical protein
MSKLWLALLLFIAVAVAAYYYIGRTHGRIHGGGDDFGYDSYVGGGIAHLEV